jgi:hypothetical protein
MASNDSKSENSPEDEDFLALHGETPAEQEAREQHIKKVLERLEEERRKVANLSQEEILASMSPEAIQKDFDRIMSIAMEGYMAIAMMEEPPEKDTKSTASEDFCGEEREDKLND